jgi:hypothetical protein
MHETDNILLLAANVIINEYFHGAPGGFYTFPACSDIHVSWLPSRIHYLWLIFYGNISNFFFHYVAFFRSVCVRVSVGNIEGKENLLPYLVGNEF